MSWMFNWLMGKSTKQLLHMKKSREEKIARLQKELEEIDKMLNE